MNNIKNNIHIWLITNDIKSAVVSTTSTSAINQCVEALIHSPLNESNKVMRDDLTLKSLLAKHTGQSIEEIKIQRTVLGKPFLVGHPKTHFSVSHTRNFSCIAISSMGDIGVDIENEGSSLKDQDLPFTALSRDEQSFCLAQSNKRRAFFSIWTAKEAFLKALGCGLSMPLSDFSVLPLPNDQSYHFIPHTAALESIQTTFKSYLTEDGTHITCCILI